MSVLVLGFAPGAPQPAKSAESFVNSVGVNTHLNYFDSAYNNYPLIKDKLSTLGVRHIRDAAHLTDDPDYNRIVYDRYKDLNAELGVRANLLVDLRSENLDTIDSSKIARVADMAGSALESFEGTNEYDLSDDPDWANVLYNHQRDLYRAVKDNDSTANVPVLGPSIVYADSASRVGDLNAYFDYGNMHPYPGGDNPGSQVLDNNIEDSRPINGDKPFIPTETGYHNAVDSTSGHVGVPEAVSGKYIPRLFLDHFARGIPRTYSYELIDLFPRDRDGDGVDDRDPENNFGLLRNDGSEKPAYMALENLLGLLSEPPAKPGDAPFVPGALGYSLSGDTQDVRQVLLQKRDGRFYLVLWQEVSGYDPDAKSVIPILDKEVTLTFDRSIEQATTYLPNISATPVEQHSEPGQLTLDVPDHPLVVEITPG